MKTRLLTAAFCLILLGCTTAGGTTPAVMAGVVPQPVTATRPPQPAPTQTLPAATMTASSEPTGTLPPATVTPTAVPVPILEICAPLENLTRGGLAASITNPFNPPPFGSDAPHQGVDISVLLPGTGVAVGGDVVRAVLAGKVSVVIPDRFPYGNAILIETPLEPLLDAGLELPPPDAREPVASALTCPGETVFPGNGSGSSIYTLYAHLQELPEALAGEELACGSPIGQIGDTGNALNPHLHLETRIGPAGVVFPGMSHYSPGASTAEMDAYCAWRIGGAFRLLDPLSILLLTEW
jgi:murein DD-endopeptidase MepM/ murein hydrolase activator NlpD